MILHRPPFAYIGAVTFLDVRHATASSRQQIELCALHCDVVIARECKRGLKISDRRVEQGE
jgi:hypothetical protein